VTEGKKKPGKRKAKAAPKAVADDALSQPKSSPQPPPPIQSYQPAFCIIGENQFRVFGRSVPERIREQFRRAGLTAEITRDDISTHQGPIILVNALGVLDQPLIAAILKRPNLALVSEKETGSKVLAANVRSADAEYVIKAMLEASPINRFGVLQRAPSEMDANYWQALRKRETPYALPLTSETLAATEWRMFMGTYKGATDLVTKHLWPVPAFHATRFLATRGVTPNMVTSVGAAMTIAAFFLFLNGLYAWGLLAAWLMTFLDTVDGKLARTTLTSSKWGDIFDHGIDLVHPPFWYAAWAIGLSAWTISWSAPIFWWTLAAILGGYVVQRLMEGISIKWLGLEIHIWRKIDTFFRQITARRNPNLILLTIGTVIAKPDGGLLAVAAWTVICLLLHGIQLLQAFSEKRKNGPLQSWMTKP
jgi:phosphatidylglycerophosphate synthase